MQQPDQPVRTAKYHKEYTIDTLPISAERITRLQLARDNGDSVQDIASAHHIPVEEVVSLLAFADTHETELDALHEQQLEKRTQQQLEALQGTHTAIWKDYVLHLFTGFPGTYVFLRGTLDGWWGSFTLADIIPLIFIILITAGPWFEIITRLQTAYGFNQDRVFIKGRWFSNDEYISNREIMSIDMYNSAHRQEVRIVLHDETCRSLTLLSTMKAVLEQFEDQL